jgi:hypothetical protein
MTHLDVHGFDAGELTALASLENGELRVALSGCADSRVMAPLRDLVLKVHEEMIKTHTPQAVVDFRNLEFMNSSCFKAFVTWLSRVQDLDPASRYRIRFISDNGKLWQRRSLSALSCFAADVIQVEG